MQSRLLMGVIWCYAYKHYRHIRHVHEDICTDIVTSLTFNSLPTGYFLMLFVICWFFSKSTFSKNHSFRNMIREAYRLDLNQARHFVGPDLGPNCLQCYQQMILVGKELIMTILSPFFQYWKGISTHLLCMSWHCMKVGVVGNFGAICIKTLCTGTIKVKIKAIFYWFYTFTKARLYKIGV